MDQTVLDELLSGHAIACQTQPVKVVADDMVHVVGTQEPVREQPDDRARMLLTTGWLRIEHIQSELPEEALADLVATVQQAARTWLKQAGGKAKAADREQVRWLVEKTRSHESKLQIAQRVWLAIVIYSLGFRGLVFDEEGQIRWQGGMAGRIGLSPDDAIDLAWQQGNRETYTASFRHADGTITRGKGRRRWDIYKLIIDPAAEPLFARRAEKDHERVALIVASETHATQPQLPRDFYGGDAFQQACIDAQDHQYDHILVLSPEHGIMSLDDTIPSDLFWDEVLERRIWDWQARAIQRLGRYLFGTPPATIPAVESVNWWAWLNPESVYELTVFGKGFAVHILTDHMIRSRTYRPGVWPEIVLADQRPGYDIGDLDEDLDFDFTEDPEDRIDIEDALQDIDQLLEWAAEFVTLVNVYVPPTGEVWELAPDEALIPVRLLAEIGMDFEEMLDLLTDISLLLEHAIPISLLINAQMAVSVLLQITHSLVHNEHKPVHEMLEVFPEDVLRQYIETAIQETNQEDRLCACLTLAEQMHLIALTIPPAISDQLLVWLQTYLSARMRRRILGNHDDPSSDFGA
jgi:hypothetical protein